MAQQLASPRAHCLVSSHRERPQEAGLPCTPPLPAALNAPEQEARQQTSSC